MSRDDSNRTFSKGSCHSCKQCEIGSTCRALCFIITISTEVDHVEARTAALELCNDAVKDIRRICAVTATEVADDKDAADGGRARTRAACEHVEGDSECTDEGAVGRTARSEREACGVRRGWQCSCKSGRQRPAGCEEAQHGRTRRPEVVRGKDAARGIGLGAGIGEGVARLVRAVEHDADGVAGPLRLQARAQDPPRGLERLHGAHVPRTPHQRRAHVHHHHQCL